MRIVLEALATPSAMLAGGILLYSIFLIVFRNFLKKKNKAMPLVRNRMKQYPKVVAAMARRHEDYNREVAYIRYRERAGKVFVLRPEASLDLSRTEHDPAKLLKAYDHGRAVAEKRLAALKEFLHAGGTPNER